MNIKIPVTRSAMLAAILEHKAQMDALTDEFGDKVLEVTKEAVGANAGEKARKAAEFFGITTGEIINSPNYATLISEFEQAGAEKVIEFIKKEAGVSEACAWGIFMEGMV